MSDLQYGYRRALDGVTFDAARERVEAALKEQGFGILTEIDVKETLKNKLDVDFRRYTILGACNPNLAHEAIGKESHIGLLLPCNVLIQELEGGAIEVSIANPKAMFTIVDNSGLESLAEDADGRLRTALDAL